MDLVLTVVGCPSHANMLNHTKVFKSNGGLIGRSDANDWVLPDAERIVSSRHAEIQFSSGKFLIVDHSTNGTFINENQTPIGTGNTHELCSGDILNCGEYQLRVTIKTPPAEPPVSAGLGSVDFLDAGDRTTFNPVTAARQQAAAEARELDSWLDPAASRSPVPVQEWGSASALFQDTPSPTDPWSASAPVSSVLSTTDSVDPLAVLNRGSLSPSPSAIQDWDDDWWKSGSTADNAPADQHHMQVNRQQEFIPPEPPEFSPATAHGSNDRDNPFAASGAGVVATENIDSLLGIVSPPVSRQKSVEKAPADDFFQPSGRTETYGSEIPVRPAAESPASVAAPVSSGKDAHVGIEELQQLASLLGVGDIKPEQLRTLVPEISGMISETVTRLIDLLRARTAIKNELRVQHTLIQTVDNNPLKFSASAADALKAMLGGDRSAFMKPTQAIQDSFDDLSDHQVAVLEGMHAAYQAMLGHFDPENLKRYINARDSLLGNKDAKNWIAFEQYYGTLKRDYEATYNKLFGEEFARSYEKQLAELKNTRALNQHR